VLLVISMCKFCKGCAMQFGGSGAASDGGSAFWIAITHRATHRMLRGNSSPKKTFLSSPYSPDLTQTYSERITLSLLSTTEQSIEKMCVYRARPPGKGKRCLTSYHCREISPSWELFDFPSYFIKCIRND
jgi:hypothetical protein